MKQSIIVFGIGSIYKKYADELSEYNIIAYADSNEKYIGAKIEHVPIISPHEIMKYEFNYIVICASHTASVSIHSMLINDFKLSNDKIVSVKYFIDKKTWAPRTVLSYCKGYGIKNIHDKSDYFKNHGVMTNTNVIGKNFDDICWNSDKAVKCVLVTYKGFEDKKKDFFIVLSDNKYNNVIIIDELRDNDYSDLCLDGYTKSIEYGLDVNIIRLNRQWKYKIFVVTHKHYTAFDNPLYQTIWVGPNKRTMQKAIEEQGDHIRELNDKINECTALYWFWKNTEDDIIGLNHYRRFFQRRDTGQLLQEKDIEVFLSEYDIIVANAALIYPKTNKQRLEDTIDKKAFCKAYHLILNQIENEYGDYLPMFHDIMNGYAFFPCNMFITKREELNQYCEWLFDIVLPVAERFDNRGYDNYSKRVIGFLAERLLTVWLCKQDLRILELPIR